jgi:uncharacterized membrane protein
MNEMFDYISLATRLGISDEQLSELEQCVRAQHPSDQMMFELRMMQTLQAVAEGTATLEQTLTELASSPPRQTA